MQRPQRAVAEQLLQPRCLEDAVRAGEGQRRAGDMADRLADHVFGAIEGGGGCRGRPFRVAQPGRVVSDQSRRFELGADLGDVAAHIRVIGERLGITFRLSRVHDPAQFIEGRLRDAEINRGVGAPEPVQIGVPERPHIVRAKHRRAVRQPAFIENQRVAAGRAHAEHIPIRVDAAPLRDARQQ